MVAISSARSLATFAFFRPTSFPSPFPFQGLHLCSFLHLEPSPHSILTTAAAAAAAKLLQSCPTLCDPIDGSPPGSPILEILQARTLEWLPFPLQCMKVKSEREVAQSCLTLSDPMNSSPPGSSVHGIFHARVLEWIAIAFFKSLC